MKCSVAHALRSYATEQLDELHAEHGASPEQLDELHVEHRSSPDDRDQELGRLVRRMISVGGVPDDVLEALPEVSRHNEPQVSPQEYECGCVAVTRITDRDCRTWLGCDEKPYEMRLAMSCDGVSCELEHLRLRDWDGAR